MDTTQSDFAHLNNVIDYLIMQFEYNFSEVCDANFVCKVLRNMLFDNQISHFEIKFSDSNEHDLHFSVDPAGYNENYRINGVVRLQPKQIKKVLPSYDEMPTSLAQTLGY